MKREEGFTLIELMAVIAIVSVLLTLGVMALRYYWLGNALYSERDEAFTNLRGLQQQVVSETNPIVFGAWFKVTTPATYDGSAQWGTVRYTPADTTSTPTTPASCTKTSAHRLGGGVHIASVGFGDSLAGVPSVADVVATCKSQVSEAAAATDFVFFLARGTATPGCVTLTQPRRDMTDATVAVGALTGRVERISQTEAAAECP